MNQILGKIVHSKISPSYLRYRRGLFKSQPDVGMQKQLFRDFVTYVEVEVHSFCNRTCWFCPNSFIDRITKRNYMDERVYLQLLDDLASINYSHIIGYSRYNEPTGDEVFFTRLAQAHERLPKVRLLAHTNSDYLKMDMMKRLHEAGLRWLNIQVYPPSKEFNLAQIHVLAERIMRRISDVQFRLAQETSTRLEYEARYGEMEVRMYGQDFTRTGIDRGGLDVNQMKATRTAPCLYPIWGVFIDWDGNVMPCCNLRSDNPAESNCATGLLTAQPGSVFAVYAGREAARWRSAMYGFGPKTGVCAGCTAASPPDTFLNRTLVKAVRPLFGPR